MDFQHKGPVSNKRGRSFDFPWRPWSRQLLAEKLPENLFGELFDIGGIAPSAAREYTEYIFG